MNEIPTVQGKKNPYTIWFVVLAFVAPVALAYLMFFYGNITSFSNHGEILSPVVDITTLKLKDEKGKIIPEKALRYKWRLISFVDENCDESCNARLYDVRQIHKALGKNQHRVLRVIVHLKPPVEELTRLIKKEYPNALIMYGDEKVITSALGDSAGIHENVIYIMDPMGNIMMRFTQDQTKKDFLKDLGRLLKVSQIG
ncbi:MAG: cytochrome c oxidase subunit I [Gammaproteobacteria bacterium]|nr:MAG: cytochrome c oxidase subunit I [Gammaproteobacteria bacterium]